MTNIRQVLDDKGSDVWAIDPDDSVFNAISEMSNKDTGGLLVLEGDNIVGIITERDYTRNVILKGKTSLETPVRDVMTANVICATPAQTVLDCLQIMTDNRIRHLPVLDNDRLIGLVSIGDLAKQIINAQKLE